MTTTKVDVSSEGGGVAVRSDLVSSHRYRHTIGIAGVELIISTAQFGNLRSILNNSDTVPMDVETSKEQGAR